MAERRGVGPNAITAITLKGFKSFAEEARIEIRPLTLLAGANSSGKSSVMQPLLLMKQTEEASYDPGPLLLDGPYVRFTSATQMLSLFPARNRGSGFEAGFELGRSFALTNRFSKISDGNFELAAARVRFADRQVQLLPGAIVPPTEELAFLFAHPAGHFDGLSGGEILLAREVFRRQGFLEVGALMGRRRKEMDRTVPVTSTLRENVGPMLRGILHVPGLRGNPERTYPRAAIGDYLPGPFAFYVASLIAGWQEAEDDLERPQRISSQLQALGLTSGIKARLVDATAIELLVGLLPKSGKGGKLVNIADVGFGVSQVLPVLVALLTAGPEELVHIEQPELHLHPRAQQVLASILADAAKRGVRVVAETHSSTLILAVQTLVAQGQLDPAIVKLHWFQRDARGATKVTSGDLDDMGRYGEWPEDFGEVESDADRSYLKAVGAKAFGKARKR